MVTDWLGDGGELKKLSISYKGMNLPDEAITCRGAVTKRYSQDGQSLVSLNIWAENPAGEKTLTGTAVVSLLTKG